MTFETLSGPLLSLLLGYALGSIPFGLILTRLAGAGDLRAIGSGNIGATNVLRTGRKDLAAATVLLDMGKGTVAIVLAYTLFDQAPLAALGAFFGHLYPVWLRFAGGKGVATLFGLLLGFTLIGGLSWLAPLAFAIVWLGMLGLTRYSSVGGLSAAVAAPIAAGALGRLDLALLFLGFALLVFWKHRENMSRLFAGTESRVGAHRA
ncbi:MAG TPA: glycerol-3-phosphate 1-O-acyltransferase PlsY [Allosphingosinicella sp.]|nr:glycerol-3-phosphate 1-O-acyltransferase PlsY [Allosphingosinicella sp.]